MGCTAAPVVDLAFAAAPGHAAWPGCCLCHWQMTRQRMHRTGSMTGGLLELLASHEAATAITKEDID